MNVNKEISDFLRDAQYKLALITIEMDQLEDDGDVHYAKLKYDRWELDYFFHILYETRQAIEGGFNWLDGAEWKDKEILNEIHYLRHKHRMNGSPILDYGTVTNKIVNVVQNEVSTSPSDGSLPTPTGPNKILTSNASGGWEEGSFTKYVGMLDTESLNTYFTGRL